MINLDSNDFVYKKFSRVSSRRKYQEIHQRGIVHEYGHVLGYLEDEYKDTHRYNSDFSSVMNVGEEIRSRHIQHLLVELNKMISNTEFYL